MIHSNIRRQGSAKLILAVMLITAVWTGLAAGSGTDVVITMDVIGEGITTPPEGDNLFYTENTVGLLATAAGGWYFNRWICEDTDFQIVDPNSNITSVDLDVQKNFKITAVFTSYEDSEPVPQIQMPHSDVTITSGESVNFQGTAAGGNPPYTYSWHFGGGVPDSNQEDPGSQFFNKAGVYEVSMTVFDDDGDSAADTITVTVVGDGGGGSGGGGCFIGCLFRE
jgi:hypothetical protein